MKLGLLLAVSLGCPLSALAQEKAVIEGVLADGTPTAPVEKAELPELEIKGTVQHELADRTITINRVVDPGLPSPTLQARAEKMSPEEAAAWRNSPEVQQWIADAAEDAKNTIHLFLSATVVDRKATLLRWWHEEQEFEAWSTIDFNHLTGFTTCKKEEHRVVTLMGIGNLNSAMLGEDVTFNIPKNLPQESAKFILTKGDANNFKALQAISILHELYQNEGPRLRAASESRERKHRERQAELQANPPKPRDIVLNYWKVQPKKEGGAQ